MTETTKKEESVFSGIKVIWNTHSFLSLCRRRRFLYNPKNNGMHFIECLDIWCLGTKHQPPGWMGERESNPVINNTGRPPTKQQPKQPTQPNERFTHDIYLYISIYQLFPILSFSVSLHKLHIVIIDFLLRY